MAKGTDTTFQSSSSFPGYAPSSYGPSASSTTPVGSFPPPVGTPIGPPQPAGQQSLQRDRVSYVSALGLVCPKCQNALARPGSPAACVLFYSSPSSPCAEYLIFQSEDQGLSILQAQHLKLNARKHSSRLRIMRGKLPSFKTSRFPPPQVRFSIFAFAPPGLHLVHSPHFLLSTPFCSPSPLCGSVLNDASLYD